MIITLIRLTEAEKAEATKYAATVMGRVVGPNYTSLEMVDRFYVGRLGELAVKKWATTESLMFEETVNDQGVPDEQDFLFHFKDGRVARTNVKNSMHPQARYLMQPVAQADRHEQDVYIGASGKNDGNEVVVRLWGAISRQQFMEGAERVQRSIETLQYPLSKLPYRMEHLAYRVLQKTTRRH